MSKAPRFLKADAIVDFPKAEEAIRAFWKEKRIFEKSVEGRRGARSFVWHDGPPTANGKPHNGHVLTRVFKDIVPPYRTMRGFRPPPNPYLPSHKDYIESVWWALSRLLEKNLLYKGHKVLWWWAHGGTALSAADAGLGHQTG